MIRRPPSSRRVVFGLWNFTQREAVASMRKKETAHGFPTPATLWTSLEDVMLGAISQPQKDKYCRIPLI